MGKRDRERVARIRAGEELPFGVKKEDEIKYNAPSLSASAKKALAMVAAISLASGMPNMPTSQPKSVPLFRKKKRHRKG